MEKSRTDGGRIWFLCGLLGTFFLLSCCTSADAAIEVSDPTGNVNLSPFQQWRNAYECLLNVSNSCPDKYRLTEGGWINVTKADTATYCTGGCADHTRAVLKCIHLVKQDYKFINGASVQDLNGTITVGCKHGFAGATIVSSATKLYESIHSLFFSALSTLLLVQVVVFNK